MTKDEIRKYIRLRKSTLNENDKINNSLKIFQYLEQLPSFINSRNILAYYSLPDEVNTKSFIDNWCENKIIFLPKIVDDKIQIVKYQNIETLKRGKYNILEPDDDLYYSLNDIEIALIPAMALDYRGNRVGRGKGYYDKFLTDSKIIKIGIIYGFQLIDNFITDKYDVPLDYAITEDGILKF